MKKIILGLFLLASATATLSSCKDTDKIPAPEYEELPLIFPQVSSDTSKAFIKNDVAILSTNSFADSVTKYGSSYTRPVFEFTIAPTDRSLKIRTVEVYKSHGVSAGGGNYTYTPRVKQGDYSSFPATISLNSDQILDGLTFNNGAAGYFLLVPRLANGSVDPTQKHTRFIAGSSVVLFTFEYILEDGRRIVLTPLDRNGVVTGTFTNPPYAMRAPTANFYNLIPPQ